MQTVSEINNAINNLIAPLFPMKVKDFGDLHRVIQGAVNDFLGPFEMEYGVWVVRLEGEEWCNKIDCFKLNEDFIEDKRCARYNRRGVMRKMWFSACSIEFENGLVPMAAKALVETKRLEEKITAQETYLTKLEAELATQKDVLTNLKAAYKMRIE